MLIKDEKYKEKNKFQEKNNNEKEKDEIEERKWWSICGICNKEYGEDIRILPNCFHSFCYECILNSTLNSYQKNCPICHVKINFFIPNLPPNFPL